MILLEGLVAALLAGGWLRQGGFLGTVMLGIFTLLLLVNGPGSARGDCGCLPVPLTNGYAHLALNLCLIGLHLVVLTSSGTRIDGERNRRGASARGSHV